MFPARLNTLQSRRLPSTAALPFFSLVEKELETGDRSGVPKWRFWLFVLPFVFRRAFYWGFGGLRVEETIKKVVWAARGELSLETQFLIINKQQELALPSGPQIVQYATRESRQGTRMETVGSDYSFKISLEHVGWR